MTDKETGSSSTRGHVERARDGHDESLTKLYERLAPALYAWAAIRIHPRHHGRLDPYDVVQDTWWRALNSFNTYDPQRGNFRAWIFRIATNVLTDGYRRMAIRGENASEDKRNRSRTPPSEIIAQMTSISRAVARSEDVARIIEAVENLENDDRALLAHCGLEGLGTNEAALILCIKPEACGKRWRRLKAKLRESPIWCSFLTLLDED